MLSGSTGVRGVVEAGIGGARSHSTAAASLAAAPDVVMMVARVGASRTRGSRDCGSERGLSPHRREGPHLRRCPAPAAAVTPAATEPVHAGVDRRGAPLYSGSETEKT